MAAKIKLKDKCGYSGKIGQIQKRAKKWPEVEKKVSTKIKRFKKNRELKKKVKQKNYERG